MLDIYSLMASKLVGQKFARILPHRFLVMIRSATRKSPHGDKCMNVLRVTGIIQMTHREMFRGREFTASLAPGWRPSLIPSALGRPQAFEK